MTDCTHQDCGRPAFARGVCRWHYDQERKSRAQPCSVGGCGRTSTRKGVCDVHYRADLAKRKPLCTVAGCPAPQKAHGLCDKHYHRKWKHGNTANTRARDWGSREKHPLYKTWAWHKRGVPKTMVQEWADDFWLFVDTVGEKPGANYRLRRHEVDKPIGPDNFFWDEKYVVGDGNAMSREERAAYMREYRKRRPRNVRSTQLKKQYGITLSDWEEMFAEQGGKCAVCGQVEGAERYANLAVDHCHVHGHVRGLLCNSCNRGLGMFRDDPETLEAAAAYLRSRARS